MSKSAEVEHKILEEQDIKSVVVISMFIHNELFGFFGFDSVKSKKPFSTDEIEYLEIFTSVITNAFSKYIDDERIRKLTFKDRMAEASQDSLKNMLVNKNLKSLIYIHLKII